MNVVMDTKERLVTLYRAPRSEKRHEFRIAAFSCSPPCVCDGFEVCLHLLHECGQGPIWPVFNAATEQEARAIQRQLVRFAATLDPGADSELLQLALEAWARVHGWERTHHIVWRRSAKMEG